MVAYSFKKQFGAPILNGTKRQTIRAIGKRRHARPGEELQLYTGMRTQHCKLILKRVCLAVFPVTMKFTDWDRVYVPKSARTGLHLTTQKRLNEFARRDGFKNWAELRAFWEVNHPEAMAAGEFRGVLIEW